MSEVIRVAVIGAAGRMGREVVKLVLQDPDLELLCRCQSLRSRHGCRNAGRTARVWRIGNR